MNDTPFDENSLSEEDQAVLRAFANQNEWPQAAHTDVPASTYPRNKQTIPLQDAHDETNDDTIFDTFLVEAQEDIQTLKTIEAQLTHDSPHFDLSYFLTLRRAAHKLRGTAAEMGYIDLSNVAGYIEEITEQTGDNIIPADNALKAIVIAISILEVSFAPLQQGSMQTADINTYIPDFLAVCAQLSIDPFPEQATPASSSTPSPSYAKREATPAPSLPNTAIHVDRQRLNCLLLRAAQLGEQQAILEDAQEQVTQALQELQQAQKELLQVETTLTPLLAANFVPAPGLSSNKLSSSSLIARLQRNTTRNAPHMTHKYKYGLHSAPADETAPSNLELVQFSEREYLLLTFKEAFTRVSRCTTRLQEAYHRLNTAQNNYVNQTSQVRDSVLTIPMVPFSGLVSQLAEIVANSTLGRQHKVEFTVQGETNEIDQDILAALTPPFIKVFETCTAASALEYIEQDAPYQIWLHLYTVGKEIFIEFGFSIDIHGGIIDMLRAPLEQFHGVLTVDHDHASGICFTLQFSSTHDIVQGLLVRARDVYALIPISQIQKVTTLEQDSGTENFHLADLLDLPASSPQNRTSAQASNVHPILILRPSDFLFTTSVGVDEVIDHIESTVKPLPYGKNQPGIRGVAIDSQQHVLLVPDLRRLIALHENNSPSNPPLSVTQRVPHILIADDSALIRDSLVNMLSHSNYEVTEVKNGKEALRQFTVSIPDIALLDIEMPLLNGYDLLKIIRSEPALARMKTIILTSRVAEKHRQYAIDLGVDAYLIKPIREDKLLQTIQSLLDNH